MILIKKSPISKISWWWAFIKRARPTEICHSKCNFKIIKNSHWIGQVSKPTLSCVEAKLTAKMIKWVCSTKQTSRILAPVKTFSMLKMIDNSNDRTWVLVVDKLCQRSKVLDKCFIRISTSEIFLYNNEATSLSLIMGQFHYLTLLYKVDKCT